MNLYEEYKALPNINIKVSKDGLRATVKYQHVGVNWHDEHYMMARGLVLDTQSGTILARPYRKFFNYGQFIHDDSFNDLAQWRNEPFTVEEKLDGSLAIMYYANDELHIGSTGSPDFYDDTTETYVLDNVKHLISSKTYQHLIDITKSGITLLFEYINPKHQIVIEYDQEMLVLHGAIHNLTGYDYSIEELYQLLPEKDILKVPVYEKLYSFEDVKKQLDKLHEKEGFVVRFESGFRLKMKTAEYLALAPKVSMFSKITIKNIERWIALFDLDILDDMTANIETMPFVNKNIKPNIEHLYQIIAQFDNAMEDSHLLNQISTRELFESAKSAKYASLLLNIWNNRHNPEELQRIRYRYIETQMRGKNTNIKPDTFDDLDDFFEAMNLAPAKREYKFR